MEENKEFEQVNENVEGTSEEVKPEYNTAPRFLPRILSGLVDYFLVFLAGFLLFQIIMATPWGTYHNSLRNDILNIQDDYALKMDVGHKMYEDEENYSSLSYGKYIYTEEEGENVGKHYVVVENETITDEAKTNYKAALNADSIYLSRTITYKANYYGMLMTGLGVSELILVFVIPLVNKRRATIGKFVALTSLMSKNEEKAKWWQLLIRFAFVLLIETALPLYFLNEIASLLIVALINIVVILISKKTRRTLRDYVSKTMIINKNSFKPISEQ